MRDTLTPDGVDWTLRGWRQRLVTAAQDACVKAWQTAWVEGCAASWAGQSCESRAYGDGQQSDAWIAGWKWAHNRPNRREAQGIDPNWAVRSKFERRRAFHGGILEGAMLPLARWALRPSKVSSVESVTAERVR